MASKWPGVGTSVGRTPLQDQEQLEEENMRRPAAGHPETSGGALGSLCRHFQRRLPLRAVSLNLGTGPSWKRLESPGPGQQGLQAAARSAKSALGAVSQTFWWRGAGRVQETPELRLAAVGSEEPQTASEPMGVLSPGPERTAPACSVNRWRIQESCHSGTKWLVETQVTARRRRRGAQKGPRLSGAAPAYAALDPWDRDGPRLSAHGGPRTYPLRRSRREAALRCPYSSTEPLCSPSESDSDLEPVGAGLQHLQQLSPELDEAIVAEERGDMTDMTVSLIRD